MNMMGRSAAMMNLDELFEQGLKCLTREDNTGVWSAMAYHYFNCAFEKDSSFAKSSVYLGLIDLVMDDRKGSKKELKTSLKQSKSARNKPYQAIAKELLEIISKPAESFSNDDRLCITKICEKLDSLHRKDTKK